jgi:hypothetical protein
MTGARLQHYAAVPLRSGLHRDQHRPAAIPDPDTFVACLRDSFEEICALAQPAGSGRSVDRKQG